MKKRLLLGFCAILVLLLFLSFPKKEQGDMVISDDGLMTLKVQKDSLPEGISLQDLSIKKIQNPPDGLVGYKLEPDGLRFNKAVPIEFQTGKIEGTETTVPILFHKEKAGVETLNLTFAIREDGSSISSNITHFSAVYYVEPVKSPNDSNLSKSFYKISRSHPESIEAYVGESYETGFTFRKIRDRVSFTHDDGTTTTFQIFADSEWISGFYDEERAVPYIYSPIEKLAPPYTQFTSSSYKVTQSFTCVERGWRGQYYDATFFWSDYIEGLRTGKSKKVKVTFRWEVDCEYKKTSCSENTKDPKDFEMPEWACVDDCEESTYCDLESCTCKKKKPISCAGDETINPLLPPSARSQLYCQEDCDAGLRCNTNICECEEIPVTISCSENTWEGDSEDYDKFICNDDCAKGYTCEPVSCTCTPLEEEEEEKIKIGEDPEEEEGCINSLGIGEIKVIDKSGIGTWEVAGDGYEAGLLTYSWVLEHTDPERPVGGIGMNYKVTGARNSTGWVRTDEDGTARITTPIWEKGTYTAEIVDFETFGAYCGDGDAIVMSAG
jgi:hypothetical protein